MRHRGSGDVATRASVALLVLCLHGCGPPSPPNVLLVVVDTLRADHCSAYGYARDTTPALSDLAAEGVRFERAYAPVGLTAPTHASLFTALHPLSHGLVRNGLALGEEAVTLAEYLSVRGFQTAAVVSSFVLHRRFGLDQGFTFYDDAFDPAEASMQLAEWEGHRVDEGFDRRGDATTRRAVHWLREQRSADAPFFLFVHYFDPHSPYEPVAAFADRFRSEGEADAPAGGSPDARAKLAAEIDAYDAEIAYTDAAIAELLASLDELGLADDTIVVVTADHGEGLMQRGYMLHGLSVYEEEVRVPLLMRWPAGIPGGRSVAEPVSVLDLMPTLGDLVATSRFGGVYEGSSLAAALRGDARLDPERPVYVYRRDFGPTAQRPVVVGAGEGDDPVTIEVAGTQHGLRAGRWKYVLAPREAAPVLYDLEGDPAELEDVAARHPEKAQELRQHLEAWIRAHGGTPVSPRQPSAEDRSRLRALGYAE